MKYQVFFSPSKKKYYMSDPNVSCEHCKIPLIKCVLMNVVFYRRRMFTYFYCLNRNYFIPEDRGISSQILTIILSPIRPPDAYRVFPQKPDLSPMRAGDISVFDAATKDFGREEIIDRTIYSMRTEGLCLVKDDVLQICEEKDKNIPINEGLSLLDELSHAKPYQEIITAQETKKLLEDRS